MSIPDTQFGPRAVHGNRLGSRTSITGRCIAVAAALGLAAGASALGTADPIGYEVIVAAPVHGADEVQDLGGPDESDRRRLSEPDYLEMLAFVDTAPNAEPDRQQSEAGNGPAGDERATSYEERPSQATSTTIQAGGGENATEPIAGAAVNDPGQAVSVTTTTSRPPTTARPGTTVRPTTTSRPRTTARPGTTVSTTPPPSTTARPTTTVQATTTTTRAAQPPERQPIAIRETDLQYHVDGTGSGFADTWGSVQCNGRQISARDALGAFGNSANGQQRVGIEQVGGSRAIALRTSASDDRYAGGLRCEFFFGQRRVPRTQNVWQSFSIRTNDLEPTSDKQIVAQWHDSQHSPSKTPFLAWYVSGDQLEIVLRSNANSGPTNATSATQTVYSGPWNGNSWDDWIVQANISPDGSPSGFVNIWRDGELVVQYEGAFGYNVAELDHVKLGFYHWQGGNEWDPAVGVRTVWVRHSALVLDPTERYQSEDIGSLMESDR